MAEVTQPIVCSHCGNTAPHARLGHFLGEQLFEHMEGRRFNEPFAYELFQCPTCNGISLYGDFVDYPLSDSVAERRLYPRGNRLLPEVHKTSDRGCIPHEIVTQYEQAWPLRHLLPSAFVVQVRRILEFICRHQGSRGKTLHSLLQDLAARGVLPRSYAEATDLIRTIGNIGAHAGDEDVDYWDAELLDDFLRWIVDFLYVAPAEIETLRRRIQRKYPST
jgi:hypothetical protein